MKRIALIAAGLLAAQSASAGVYVETVDHNLTTNTSELETEDVRAERRRPLRRCRRAASTLIKGDTMYMIDDADKSYIVFDKATMEQLAEKLNAEDGQDQGTAGASCRPSSARRWSR